MKIPDEAVEEAARSLFENSPVSKGHQPWDSLWGDGRIKAQFRQDARAALEAATPHIQGRAWEEGYGLGYSDAVWSKGHEPRERNPYRKSFPG